MNRTEFDISVGILSYQRTDLLIETIETLLDTSYQVELVVLNNNDFCILNDILKVLDGVESISLNYLHFGTNLGVSSGRRAIIENTSSDYIILLDDDVVVQEFDKIISEVLNEFNLSEKLGAIAFNIKEYTTGNNNKYEIPHKNKRIDMSSDFNTYLIIGAGNALRVPYVKQVGNFANDFGLYGFEEIDVAFRLISYGYEIKYKSNCIIKHKKSPDGRFSGSLVNQLYFENRTRMAKRYLKKRYYYSCFLVRACYLLYKTKSFSLAKKSIVKVLNDDVNRKFDKTFYNYIKSVNGFIWY